MFTDIGRPGVFGDSIIFENSVLKSNIDLGNWLGSQVLDLKVGDVIVRPFLIGDCGFKLSTILMKIPSQSEMVSNPVLKMWDDIAS